MGIDETLEMDGCEVSCLAPDFLSSWNVMIYIVSYYSAARQRDWYSIFSDMDGGEVSTENCSHSVRSKSPITVFPLATPPLSDPLPIPFS